VGIEPRDLRDGGEIELSRAVPTEFRVVDSDGIPREDARVHLVLGGLPAPAPAGSPDRPGLDAHSVRIAAFARVPGELACGDDGRTERVDLPSGQLVQVSAVTADALSAERSFVPRVSARDPDVRTLVLEPGPVLLIRLVSETGAAVERAHATAHLRRVASGRYGGGARPLDLRGGPIRVPRPEDVLWIDIEAPDRATTVLQPRRGADRWDGELTLVLGASHAVRFRVADTDGRPATGMVVFAAQLQPWEVPGADVQSELARWTELNQQHPDLYGGIPTDHPGWMQHIQATGRHTTTDSEGRASLVGLHEGGYRVSVSEASLRSPLWGLSLYDARQPHLLVPAAGDVELVIPSRRRVVFGVFDGATRSALFDATVSAPASGLQEQLEGTNRFDGFVSRLEERLVVQADGYLAADVVLDGSPDELEERDVVLWPGAPAQVTVTLDHGVSVQRLRARVWRTSLEDARGTSLFEESWSGDFLVEEGRALLQIPVAAGSIFTLEALDQALVLDPERLTWVPGAEYAVHARLGDESL
jgi:hypothetical protein